MSPDITINNYYLQFIYNAKHDIIEYNNCLNVVNKNLETCCEYINSKLDIIKEDFDICLTDYIEWTTKTYNESNTLYNKCIKLLKNIEEHPNKIVILQIIKFCSCLDNIYKYKKLILLADKRKDIKFSVYRKYVSSYYNKVHKCVLEGMGYTYLDGIGTYVINNWKFQENVSRKKPILDYVETKARKKELLAKGIKLYDTKEAAWYAARNIPYDGVDYRVYKADSNWFEFTFIKSKIFKNNTLEYKRTEYVVNKYRGMSYKQMADQLCDKIDDIYDLQVDIKYKLNILLYKKPTMYLNYIRNAEQCKYERGAHNS